MPDAFIDMCITSPPYDKLRNYKGYSFDFKKIAEALYRVIKVGGVLVWVVSDATIKGSETGTSFKQALYFMKLGFNLHDTMFYMKKSGMTLNHNRYEQDVEYMFILSHGPPKSFNPIMVPCVSFGKDGCRNGQQYKSHSIQGKATRSGKSRASIKRDKIKSNIWEYSTGLNNSSNDEVAFEQPAIFPEQLCADHIYSWSNKDDLIYDPMIGSGTTAKMAHLQERRWIGSEESEKYVQLANKRLQPYLMQSRLNFE